MKPISIITDFRSLGSGAPLRAAYETSKRVGLHALVFDRLVPPRGRVPRLSPVLGPISEVPSGAAERACREARRIVDGTVVLFGQEIDVGPEPDWHLLLHDDGRWPAEPWWRIDIRSSDRVGDVKWAWELGRHRHLVILARAAYCAPEEEQFAATLGAHLRSWIDQNPPERGIHWYSNLELSLRAVAWIQVLALAGDRLEPDLRNAMERHLYHSGRHIAADLPYTVSTMRNNHLLGDGMGLVALSLVFPGHRAAMRWGRLGDLLMRAQLARHIRADGSMIEDSLSYHRFVLEMLAVRVALGGASRHIVAGLLSGARFLARLGVAVDAVPQYGDWDEGRVLSASARADDMLGTIRLAAALAGSGAPSEWRQAHDELAWHVAEGLPAHLDDAVTDGRAIGGDIARTRKKDLTVWLKAGSGPSHGHADLSSATIQVRDHWVIGDPGTGTYNGDSATREYFRTSVSHPVLRLDDEDQLVPHRAFRWVNAAHGVVGEPIQIGATTIMWGVHSAYRRLARGPRVARVVLVADHWVTVGDWVEDVPRPYRLSLPLHPDVTWSDPVLELTDGHRLRLDPPGSVNVVRGSERPFDGWWSETYGSIVPATRLECRGETRGPVVWSVGDPDASPHAVDGQVLVRDGCQIEVAFAQAGVDVAVAAPNATAGRSMDFPR